MEKSLKFNQKHATAETSKKIGKKCTKIITTQSTGGLEYVFSQFYAANDVFNPDAIRVDSKIIYYFVKEKGQ